MVILLNLYSTANCHLCEQAESSLLRIQPNHDFNFKKIEITEDIECYEKYELKIPVLKRMDTGVEIIWPFDERDIQLLLSQV